MQKLYKKDEDSKKILLADDDAVFLKIMTHYLDDMGFSYVSAHDGQLAWNYLQRYPDSFFVVLADRIMPKLHGLELLTRMQQKRSLSHIPLILLTGEASEEERGEAIAQGIYDFFYKPISCDLLLITLEKIKRQMTCMR